MAKNHPNITSELQEFIQRQHLFFVCTAPLSGEGHVNVSPKGLDCFRILSPQRVAYMDYVGSGNETSAHLLENGRITFMFCSFDGPPTILRLYGVGHAVLPHMPEWQELIQHFTPHTGTRQLIVAEIHLVRTSCGNGVPLLAYQGEREILLTWAEKKGADGLEAYMQEKNLVSMDGLPTDLQNR